MTCQATADAHCCWIPGGGVCPHFDPDATDGHCTLRARLGSWDAVHESADYRPQREAFEAFGTDLCGDYPGPGVTCGECGVTGG